MSTRRAKQIIYGTFYGLIWVLFFYGIYFVFLKPSLAAPTVQPCLQEGCPPPGVRPITEQGSPNIFMTSSGHYTFLARVANVNGDYAAKNFTYNFNVRDESGNTIRTLSGQSFIYANEIKYIVVPNEAFAAPVASADLTITNVSWVPGATVGVVPNFTFQNLTTGSTSSTVVIGGQLLNKDIASFDAVIVVGIFKDANGDPTGASQTEIDNLEVNGGASFSIMYPALEGIDPGNNQIAAYALRR